MRISILFVGALRDGGFNQSALDGAERVQADPAAGEIEIVDGIPYDPAAMTSALKAAAGRSDGVVFVGGQGNLVTPPVAEAFAECAFAVVQGAVTAPNLASYDVLQEQSAFLAGVLAARHTQTGCVGHLSGHRVVPGLKGRAAFAAGVRHADPDVRLITGFCGTQDDSTVTEAWATRIADAGADVLFTMLNAARDGATRACRVTGMRQIGNVTDWCAAEPEVFVASALARIDLGVVRAVQDMRAGRGAGSIVRLGLAEGAVGLAMGPEVPAGLRARIDATAAQVSAGELQVSTTYDGPEIEAAA